MFMVPESGAVVTGGCAAGVRPVCIQAAGPAACRVAVMQADVIRDGAKN
jgi:hypothetical protein